MLFNVQLTEHDVKAVLDGINDTINKLSATSQSINQQCKTQFESEQKKIKLKEQKELKKAQK